MKENADTEITSLKQKLETTDKRLKDEVKAKSDLQKSVGRLENDLREFKHRMIELVAMLERR